QPHQRRNHDRVPVSQPARHHHRDGDARAGHRALREAQRLHARRIDPEGHARHRATRQPRGTPPLEAGRTRRACFGGRTMTFFIATRIALHAIGRNKLRSALTALGIIIGVGSLIALLGIGHGARAEVEKQVASLGENVIQVSAGSISKSAVKLGLGSSGALTVEDAEAIKQEILDAVAVSPEVKIRTQVVSGNRNWSTEIYGNSTDYFTIRQWRTSLGEIFTEQDVRGATKV